MKTNGVILVILFAFAILTSCNKKTSSENKEPVSTGDSLKIASLSKMLKNNSLNNNDSTDLLLKKVEEKSSQILSGNNYAFYLNKIGLICYSKSKYYYAKKYFSKSNKVFTKLKNVIEAAKCLSNIGVIQEIEGNYDEAIKTYFDAIEIFKKNNKELAVAKIYNNIGVVFNKLEKYDKAVKYYKLSNSIKIKLNKTNLAATGYDNIGTVYEAFGKHDSALYFYQKALKLYTHNVEKTPEREINFATVNNNIGYILLISKDEKDSARKYFEKSLKIFIKYNNNHGISNTYRNIGYLELLSGKYKKSSVLLNKALKLLENTNYTSEQTQILKLLSETYERNKNYEKAIFYLKKYQKINDSILYVKNIEKVNKIETRHRINEKDNQIKLLSAKNRVKDFRLLSVVVSFVLIISSIVILLLIFRRKKDKKYMQLKQRLFRSQMNPHFLFNALTSIQSFIFANNIKKAGFYLGSFASLTRSILNNSENEFISLEEEIKSLKNYIELEKMRLNNSFDYLLTVNDEIDVEFTLIPPMLIQPFIENAVKYGIDYENKNPFIKINFDLINESLKITVEDNGKGISKEKNKNKTHKSFALSLFKERIKTLNKTTKKDIKYKIINLSELDKNKTGTLISVVFPLIYDE